jgi:signal transduction histidine kinase
MTRVLSFLKSIGLTAQFLLLATVLYTVLAIGAGRVQNHILSERMLEGSLEIEQALARGVLLSVLGDRPVQGYLPTATFHRVHAAVSTQIDPEYINKVKIWGVDGVLVYDSSGVAHPPQDLEPAVSRALRGETIISRADEGSPENVDDMDLGSVIYEVYMPLVNAQGEIVAVGEIYCSVELLLARISHMLADTDYIRLGSLLVGIAGLAVLVAFAQKRLAQQEQSIAETLRRADQLAERNRQLFNESERLRLQASQISEAVLNRIGSELHDGPIQLLSIAALYRSQLIHAEAEVPLARKASDLLDAALADLRSISTGLVLPTLEGLDLTETVRLAVLNFRTEADTEVALDLAQMDIHLSEDTRTAIYRIVSEALHNARKHAQGKGVAVQAGIKDGLLTITVSDSGPGIGAGSSEGTSSGHVSLGLAGMRNRARSIGATLEVQSRSGRGTQVRLTLDLSARPIGNEAADEAGHMASGNGNGPQTAVVARG